MSTCVRLKVQVMYFKLEKAVLQNTIKWQCVLVITVLDKELGGLSSDSHSSKETH